MRSALAVVAVLTAVGLSGCAMNQNCGCGGGGLFGGTMLGCNTGCQTDCGGCETNCGCGTDAKCGGDCGNSCGCNGRGLYPGPFASMRMQRDLCNPCGPCDKPRCGMGEMALFSRFNSRANGCDSCGTQDCQGGCQNGMLNNRVGVKDRVAMMRARFTNSNGSCNTCGAQGGCDCNAGMNGGLLGNLMRGSQPRMNVAGCSSCGQNCGGNCGNGGLLGARMGGGMMAGNGIAGNGMVGNGMLSGFGNRMGTCGPGCRGCGGRGCGLGMRRGGGPGEQHPYGGQIPHTDGFGGPHGPISPTYAYPYYTTRGPRDFFMDNPPTIGR